MVHERSDLWLGSELGLLKSVSLAKETFTNYGNIKTLDKSQSITSMAWRNKEEENKILVGLQNGVVKTFDTNTYEFGSSVTCPSSPVRGLVALPDGTFLSCTEDGSLQQWKDSECILDKKVGDDIKVMTGSCSSDIFATGGQENELKVWRIDSIDKPIFTAKNVRNDFLNLRVPVWVSAIDFFKNDTNKLVVASGHHTVRVYDRREKRRPVLDTDWHEHPITSVSIRPSNNSVLLGNSASYMAELDLRTGKQVGAFKGNCGSIRSIVCHTTQPLTATCGLDRFLKVYDLNTRKIAKKIYMKSNLNCLLLSSETMKLSGTEIGEKRANSDDDIEESEAAEELWESMETVNDKKKQLRKEKVKFIL